MFQLFFEQIIMNRKELRQKIRLKRNALSQEQQDNAAKKMQLRLTAHKKIQTAQHIAIYITNDGELNTTPFINWCWQQNKFVYLPVIHPFCKGNLLFLRFDETTVMIKNKYGIAEPKLDVTKVIPIHQLDILCTPLVAFDPSGARLGMGGGFYDRTLATWYQQQSLSANTSTQSLNGNYNHTEYKLYPIGLAHDCQQVKQVPCEYWDIPLPEIITPTKTIKVEK